MVKWKTLIGKLRPRIKITSVLKALGFLVLAGIVFLSLSPLIRLPGNWRTSIVLSGSMEPKIKMGSVVVIKPSQDLKTGDVITFKNPKDPKTTFTHRISAITKGVIQTKGDANNAPDNWEVTENQVLGKVVTSLPYLGYAANFAKTPRGFLLFIILPAFLIIADELRAIKKEMEKKFTAKIASLEKEVAQAKGLDKTTKQVQLVFLALGLSLFALSFSPATQAIFSDEEKVTGNSISVAVWDVDPAVQPGEVVINELMWMGSSPNPHDEWLELRNMTDREIDLSGWQLTKRNLVGAEELLVEIPAGKKIAPHGFYLISQYDEAHSRIKVNPNLVYGAGDQFEPQFTLNFLLLQIKLYSGKWQEGATLIDQADNGDPAPAAGWPVPPYSMERNDIPGDGTNPFNWHTCFEPSSTPLYWDPGAIEKGTPGAPNLSDDNPSPEDLKLKAAGQTEKTDMSQNKSDPGTDLLQAETVTTDTPPANPEAEVTNPEPAKENPPVEETPEASPSAQPADSAPDPAPATPESDPAPDLGGTPDA